MNWLDFFFGWLIKGQYEVSTLDTIMFLIEFIIVIFIIAIIQDLIEKLKKKKQVSNNE